MASRSVDDLVWEVRKKAEIIQEKCAQNGVDLLIYCTLRPLDEQARLFRQSRSYEEIKDKMKKLANRGFDFIANVIEKVGPCDGPHVTNAAPGESWHNYGEAFDAVPLVGGKAAWSYNEFKNLWEVYGNAVREVEMSWAGDWTSFREFPHCQLRSGGNPLKSLSPDIVRLTLIEHNLIDPTVIA